MQDLSDRVLLGYNFGCKANRYQYLTMPSQDYNMLQLLHIIVVCLVCTTILIRVKFLYFQTFPRENVAPRLLAPILVSTDYYRKSSWFPRIVQKPKTHAGGKLSNIIKVTLFIHFSKYFVKLILYSRWNYYSICRNTTR